MQAASVANPLASSVLLVAAFQISTVTLGPISLFQPQINLRKIADDTIAGNLGFWNDAPDLIIAGAPFTHMWLYAPYNSVPETAAFTANTTSGSPNLSSIVVGVNFGPIVAGAPVVGPGIPAGTTILSYNAGAGTAAMSQNASATATAASLYTGVEVGDGSAYYVSLDAKVAGGATVGVTNSMIAALAANFFIPGTVQFGNTSPAGAIGAP